MVEVASRELRNRTRVLLDRVAAGEHITITVDGAGLDVINVWVARYPSRRRRPPDMPAEFAVQA